MKKLKLPKIDLKNINFNTVIPFLIGLVILFGIIYVIFLRPILSPSETPVSSPATLQEEQQQYHQDLTSELFPILPYASDDYLITLETIDGTKYIVIYSDKEVKNSLQKAYLFLQQYGILPGDPRLKLKDLVHGL